MKALEKDRTRRYQAASEVASDVRRYIDGDAVEATPPSAWYRASRFLRKHRSLVNTASLFCLSLCVLVVFMGVVVDKFAAKSNAWRVVSIIVPFLLLGLLVLVPVALGALSIVVWRLGRSRVALFNAVLALVCVGLWIPPLVSSGWNFPSVAGSALYTSQASRLVEVGYFVAA